MALEGFFGAFQDPQFREDLVSPFRRYGQQSIGGATAGLLGAPVDLATLGINAGRYLTGGEQLGQQYGGSQHIWGMMNRAGLLAPQGHEPADIAAQISGPALLNPVTVGRAIQGGGQALRAAGEVSPAVGGQRAQLGIPADLAPAPAQTGILAPEKVNELASFMREQFGGDAAKASDYLRRRATVLEQAGFTDTAGDYRRAIGLLAPGEGRVMLPSRQIGAINPEAVGAVEAAPAGVPAQQGLLGRHPTTTPARILNKARAGGYSVNLPSGEVPSSGLMVGKYANTDPRNTVISPPQLPRRSDVVEFAQKNKIPLSRAENYFGAWRDDETGKVYFDVSRRFEEGDVRKATKFGEKSKQIGIFDVGLNQTLPVGRWDEFIKSPEFAQRVAEMESKGGQYLSRHPNLRWWDTSDIENIYGAQTRPQISGFMASTAPNSDLVQNTQTFSEYMRRYLAKENILQPDWRVPQTAAFRTPGTKIGMEEMRRGNLLASARGELSSLQANKVREEAFAMMGDPNAIPLDRYWAYLSEKPSAGVFAAAKAGEVPSGKPYERLKGAVSEISQGGLLSPRDYSAQAWTGTREQIRETGNLFGQKLRTGARGESKGYADHLNDLIVEKAQRLGISVDELKNRLASGRENLLGLGLATPAIGLLWPGESRVAYQ